MRGQASLSFQGPTDQAALSKDVGSQRNTRFVWTGLGFAALIVIVLSSCALAPHASHASANRSRDTPAVAIIHSQHEAFIPFHPLPALRIPGGTQPGTSGLRPSALPGVRLGPKRHGLQMFGPMLDWQTERPVKRLTLKSGVALVPHPARADRQYELPPHGGGEDAYFVDDEIGVLGVADGVGGWAARGIDSGHYSRQLMNFAAEEVRAGSVDPLLVLQHAHSRATAEGSATALILSLNQTDGGVRVANLGDCGFVHLRHGEVLFQSPPLEHSFGTPFQLEANPLGDSIEASNLGFFDDLSHGDAPRRAEIFELKDVAAGDVLVVGTDGLFDNAFADDIATLVLRAESWPFAKKGARLATYAANEIAKHTALWAQDESRVSPYGKKLLTFAESELNKGVENMFPDTLAQLSLQKRLVREGLNKAGKLDDITVVVAVVGAGD